MKIIKEAKIEESIKNFKISGNKVIVNIYDGEAGINAAYIKPTINQYKGIVKVLDDETLEIDSYSLIAYAINNLF